MKKIEMIKDTCTACGVCASICPQKCINMKEDEYGFYYPFIHNDLCVDCKLCEKSCHIINSEIKDKITDDEFYMYWAGDDAKRQTSTSGGAFSLFSQYVLERDGVVFGSFYSQENERVEVGCTECVDLESLKKSKYVESYIGCNAEVIKKYLQEGKYVLYCGTPCQVAGIRKYLNYKKINQERLILIDFACHGVPTNTALKKLKKIFETPHKKLANIDFRYKDDKYPWHSQTMKMYFSDGTSKIINRHSFYYFYFYRAFNLSLNLRLSCYDCNQVEYSFADATIGDFWDIHKYKPELDDNKGISFIKLHNGKWQCVLDTVADKSYLERLPNGIVTDPYHKQSKINKLPERARYLDLLLGKGYFLASIRYFGLYRILRETYISRLLSSIKMYIKH